MMDLITTEKELTPEEILLEATKRIPHDRLATIVVRHNHDMASLTKTAHAELGVTPELFIAWMATKDGIEAIRRVRNGLDEVLDNALTSVIQSTCLEIVDRLKNGETFRDSDTKQTYRLPVSTRALGLVFGQMFDRRARIRSRTATLVEPSTVEALEIIPDVVEGDPEMPVSAQARDAESLARTMQALATGSSGLIVRKKTEELSVEKVPGDGSKKW